MSDMKILGSAEPLASAFKLPKNPGAPEGKSFMDTLSESLKEVNQMQVDADKAIEGLITGKSQNLHETMITMSKAEVAMKLTLQVRNKVVDAYKEVMSMGA
jgi:flagellar hook-basal body complex protein FliE